MTLLTRSPESVHTEAPAAARRNFWGWVLYQLLYRIGWQFKMESTMVAGLVGYLSPPAAAAMIMGLFTTLNKPLALGFYLATYTLFFGLLGAGDVARGALLGKIIAAEQRGRALGLSV